MIPPVVAAEPIRRWPWRVGQICQALIMGVLLVAAVIGLLGLADGAAIFVYQGY